MKIERRVGKHDFELVGNVEEIVKKIEEERNNYYDETYVNYGEIPEGDYLTEEEFNKNIGQFKEDFGELLKEDVLVEMIEEAPKKNNGTFYKGRVVKEVWGKNSEFITEWHNTWIHSIIKVKVVSDKTLEMSYEVKTNTPG